MKTTVITIQGKQFSYQDEAGDPYIFNPLNKDDANNILQLTDRLLNECGIPYFLAFGTLLGAVREGDFINGDEDVDIIISDEERLYNSLPYLYKHGLFVNRIYRDELYSFHTEGRHGHIDLYVMKEVTKPRIFRRIYTRICYNLHPKHFFTEISNDGKYKLHGKSYPYPSNPEKLLVHWYGRNWRIPQNKQADTFIIPVKIQRFVKKCFHKIKKVIH
ncbi:MAG: LicD family protein [Bacteroidales bacterium]|nr:LicD family protein [Bacteroidales bacterium]